MATEFVSYEVYLRTVAENNRLQAEIGKLEAALSSSARMLGDANAEIDRLKARASRLREELGNRGREITKLSEQSGSHTHSHQKVTK